MTNEQKKELIKARINILAQRANGNQAIINKLNRQLRKMG